MTNPSSRGRKYEQRCRAVWNHSGDQPWRYIPRALNGGPGWGVYDTVLSKFVDDELLSLSMTDLEQKLVN